MIDGLLILAAIAAGLVGWVACIMNERVNVLWKLASIVAIPLLAGALFGGLEIIRLEWWAGMRMDVGALICALLPVLAWPVKKSRHDGIGAGS
jgi:hypothetical protein